MLVLLGCCKTEEGLVVEKCRGVGDDGGRGGGLERKVKRR